MSSVRDLLSSILLVCLSVCTAHAGEIVVFGGDWQFPPHQYLNEHGEPAGFDVDVFEAIATASDIKYEFYLGDWREVQARLEAGSIDVVPMFKSDARSRKFLFTDSILIEYYHLFGHAGSEAYSSLDEIDQATVAVQKGGYAWNVLEQRSHDLNIVATDTESEALRQVATGNADLALASIHLGTYIIATREYFDVVSLSPPLLVAEYAFAVSPQRSELVDLLNEGLAHIRTNGTYDQTYRSWVSNLNQIYQAYQSGLWHSVWIIILLLIILCALLFGLIRFKDILRRTREWSAGQQQRADQAEKRVEELTQFDTLTHLPKKYLFEGHLTRIINDPETQTGKIGVASISILDLDKIQQIAGYQTADKLTREVAQLLFDKAGESVFISHFGHGRFGLIMKDIAGEYDAISRLHKIIGQAEVQTIINDYPIHVSLNSGLAFYPDHAAEAAKLYRAAELACDLGRIRRNTLLVYEQSMEPDPRNLVLISDLRKAIRNEQLTWVLQPKYSLISRSISSAEMLVRWEHPRYGEIPPNLFIPLAEESGLVSELTQLLIKKAGAYCRQWQQQGNDLALSINISGKDLSDPALITSVLQGFSGVTHRLTLEVTETAIIEDTVGILEILRVLRQHGVKIALDDYGTGYSSLAYIKQIQPDELKIDQLFIKSLTDSEEDEKIVRACIELGHELGAQVTAEGVETKRVLTKLEELRCDAVQGFAIAKPMTISEFMRYWHSGGLLPRET